jgi:hypothetical protein
MIGIDYGGLPSDGWPFTMARHFIILSFVYRFFILSFSFYQWATLSVIHFINGIMIP